MHVHVREDGKGGRRCRSRTPGSFLWQACDDDEIAMQAAPEGLLLRKVALFFPYPILDGLEGLPCMD